MVTPSVYIKIGATFSVDSIIKTNVSNMNFGNTIFLINQISSRSESR